MRPWSHDWLVAAGAYPSFCSMKRLGVFLLPPGWDASPSQVTSLQLVRFPQQFAVPIYTPGCREALWELRVLHVSNKEHNRMSLARAPTQTSHSGVKRTNHEVTAPPTNRWRKSKGVLCSTSDKCKALIPTKTNTACYL